MKRFALIFVLLILASCIPFYLSIGYSQITLFVQMPKGYKPSHKNKLVDYIRTYNQSHPNSSLSDGDEDIEYELFTFIQSRLSQNAEYYTIRLKAKSAKPGLSEQDITTFVDNLSNNVDFDNQQKVTITRYVSDPTLTPRGGLIIDESNKSAQPGGESNKNICSQSRYDSYDCNSYLLSAKNVFSIEDLKDQRDNRVGKDEVVNNMVADDEAKAKSPYLGGGLVDGQNSARVLVAIIDTGIENQPTTEYGERGFDNAILEPPDGWNDRKPEGHGTAIAYLVHALAPEARILSYKACGSDEETVKSDICPVKNVLWAMEQAVDYAFRFDYQTSNNISLNLVINLSMGQACPDPRLQYAIRELGKLGVMVVASGGNKETLAQGYCVRSKLELGVAYPAAYATQKVDEEEPLENLISVGAQKFSGKDNRWSKVVERISQDGILAWAPGIQVLSFGARENGAKYLNFFNGTSFATAQITGLVAAMRGKLQSQSPSELSMAIRTCLKQWFNDPGQRPGSRNGKFFDLRQMLCQGS